MRYDIYLDTHRILLRSLAGFCEAPPRVKSQVLWRFVFLFGCHLYKLNESEYGKSDWVIDPEGNKVEW